MRKEFKIGKVNFSEKNCILIAEAGVNHNGKISLAIIGDYKHFDKTLIITLFSGSSNTLFDILSYLQNYAIKNNFERIQILTREKLDSFDTLEYKISFNLMKKSLF